VRKDFLILLFLFFVRKGVSLSKDRKMISKIQDIKSRETSQNNAKFLYYLDKRSGVV